MRLRLMCVLALAALVVPAQAGPNQDAVIAQYKSLAAADAGFGGFSADRGKAFYAATQTGGKPDTPSCTSCHTASPLQAGKTRAGKAIDPMAVSKTPDRFTDMAKTEKWFGRNCTSVLGRDCTAQEKGDFITYLAGL